MNDELTKQNSLFKPNGTPDYAKMMLAIVKALKELGGTGKKRDIDALVIKNERISTEEQSLRMPTGKKTQLDFHLIYSRTYLKISGDLESVKRGTWRLTKAGHKINNLEDAEKALKRYNRTIAENTIKKISKEIPNPNNVKESSSSVKRKFTISRDDTPSVPGIMLATITALKEIGGLGTVQEINRCVIENEGMGEDEESYPLTPDGSRPKLDYYLSWARTYLKIIGALDNPARGVWKLTESGSKISTRINAQAAFDKCTAMIGQHADESVNKSLDILYLKKKPDETINPDPDAWRFILLKILQEMDPYAFERLCKILLDTVGFTKVTVNSKKGADGGIDGTGYLRINLISFKVHFQCKRYTKKVSVESVREFLGALAGRTGKGLFFTTSSFTKPAQEEAVRYGMVLIDLIDGEEICDLLKENSLGVQTAPDGQVTITPEWFDAI